MMKRILAMVAALIMVYGSSLLPAAGSDGKPVVNTKKCTYMQLSDNKCKKSAKNELKMPILEPIRPVPVNEDEGITEYGSQSENDASGSEADDITNGNNDGTAEGDEGGNGSADASDPESEGKFEEELTEGDQDPEEPQLSEESTTSEPDPVVEGPELEYLGDWVITAYCPCSICCGEWAGGGTASETTPTAGRTVACNILPPGTQVMIDDLIYTVEDTGSTPYGDEWIDIYFDTHEEAENYGVQMKSVYLVRW